MTDDQQDDSDVEKAEAEAEPTLEGQSIEMSEGEEDEESTTS